jgi:type I restriction enzyme M protein
MDEMKDGYVPDLATGRPVDIGKPEEAVRQEYEKILCDDYDYSYKQMDIEVHVQRGSKTKPSSKQDLADIVIYKTTDKRKRDQNEDILAIVETKRPDRKDGVRQLMSYMSASCCEWGVWTNGSEIEYIYKDLKSGEIKRDFIFQIPRRGQLVADIGRLSKTDLIPATNLKVIFRRMLNTLYANTSISRREKLGNELIRLIFCKIWDERYFPNEPPKFRIGFQEHPSLVKERVVELFNEVKAELSADDVFDQNEEIKLDDTSVAYVVGELERYGLQKTNKDVVGDAFEVFAESKLVGEKGEFFTPREIVKTAIAIVQPKPGKTILDPACGSGGFLIYALEHVWNQMAKDRKYAGSSDFDRIKADMAKKCFAGIDKEIDLVKIAKAYMAIVGDGRGAIVHENTLHRPGDYAGKAKELLVKNGEFKQFDIILTNPPFGSKTKVLKADAAQFQLGHAFKFNKSLNEFEQTSKAQDTEPQVLFIERCLEMLKDTGILAIILPETYFHGIRSAYVLEFIRKRCSIIAVVDLTIDSFKPHNNAKTVMVVLQKGVPQQKDIIMAVAEGVGHDALGRTLFRYDYRNQTVTNEIWDDTAIIREELKHPANSDNKNVFVLKADDIRNKILVPRYYWTKRISHLREAAEKIGCEFVSVGELIRAKTLMQHDGHGSPPGQFKGKGEIPYVRVADIVNWEPYYNPAALIPRSMYLKIKGNGIDLKENDILFVRRGSYRIGSVALVSRFDLEVLLAREIAVFRVLNEQNEYGINPYYLMFLFSHPLTQDQRFNLTFYETTYPNMAKRWAELLLPISKDKDERKRITNEMKQVFDQKFAAKAIVQKIKEKFGNLTT